jgi:hypothetical protein
MRFRPADIRVINRRDRRLGWLRDFVTSGEKQDAGNYNG